MKSVASPSVHSARDVMAMVVGQGMAMTFVGTAIGVAASAAGAPDVEPALRGQRGRSGDVCRHPSLLIAVALAACYVPARRAMLSIHCRPSGPSRWPPGARDSATARKRECRPRAKPGDRGLSQHTPGSPRRAAAAGADDSGRAGAHRAGRRQSVAAGGPSLLFHRIVRRCNHAGCTVRTLRKSGFTAVVVLTSASASARPRRSSTCSTA